MIKYFATETVVVVTTKERVRLLADTEVEPSTLKKLSSGQLKSLKQTRRLLSEEEYVAPPEPIPRESPEAHPDPKEGDWLSDPIEALQIEERLKKLLKDHKCETIKQVLEIGANNDDGLQSIDGIAEASEKQIQEAIEKHARAGD